MSSGFEQRRLRKDIPEIRWSKAPLLGPGGDSQSASWAQPPYAASGSPMQHPGMQTTHLTALGCLSSGRKLSKLASFSAAKPETCTDRPFALLGGSTARCTSSTDYVVHHDSSRHPANHIRTSGT